MLVAIAILAFAAATPQAQQPNPCDNIIQNVWDPRFTPDEQWTYHARPVDKGSTITITKIDNVPGIGFVIHFKVEHVTFSYDFMRGNDLTTASGPVNQTPYLALHRDSLDASAIQRIGIVDELELSSTYRQWRDNCDALSYKTTIADTIQKLQDAYWVKFCADNTIPNRYSPPECRGAPSSSVRPTAPKRTPTPPPSPTPTPPASAPHTSSPAPGPTSTPPNTTVQP